MQRWEYIELCLKLGSNNDWVWSDTGISSHTIGVSSRLTQMGLDGWELVSAYPQTGGMKGHIVTVYIYYLFKRPII
jgi:uncharacterized protein YerC